MAYDGPRSRQRGKERDPGRARQRRKKRGTRTTRRTAMKGRRIPERISTYLTRMRIDTITSPMGTRMLIRTPSGAVAVLRRTNGRAAEAMGARTKSRLSRRILIKRHNRKRYRRRRQSRRGAGSRTSRRRQQSFSLSPTISTHMAAAGGTCMGPSYRCYGSGLWMVVW